jgi:DNA-binding MarR family transcriptional regulator
MGAVSRKRPARRGTGPRKAASGTGERRPGGRADQSGVADIIGYRLRLAQIAVFKDFRKSFEALHLKPVEYTVISLVQANPGVRQGELGEALGIKRANMVSLINLLAGRGILERRPVAGDRRSHALHLTPAGAAFAVGMQKTWRRHERRWIERLGGEAERDRLVAMLDRIAKLP